MAHAGDRTFVGFGFGAIQAGLFLYEAVQSGAFDRLVVAEVVPARVAQLRAAGGYFALNIAHAGGIEQVEIGPVHVYDPAQPTDRTALIAAVAAASEMSTAIPSVAGYRTQGPGSLHRLVAAGLVEKERHNGPPLILYCAENHNQAAQELRAAVVEALTDMGVGAAHTLDRVAFLDTVIGKMSGVVPAGVPEIPPEMSSLAPITPGDEQAFLVESLRNILISQVRFGAQDDLGKQAQLGHHSGTPARGLAVFQEKPSLLPFEEAKLYCHNAGHAMAAYLGAMAGVTRMAELNTVPGLLTAVRRAMLDEAGAALVAKFGRDARGPVDPLFTTAGMTGYVDDLLVRMVNPFLLDTVHRVGRDPMRKLGWDDRLVGSMRLVLAQGGEPTCLALGVAAALQAGRGDGVPAITGDAAATQLTRHWPTAPDDQVAQLLARILPAVEQLATWQESGCSKLIG